MPGFPRPPPGTAAPLLVVLVAFPLVGVAMGVASALRQPKASQPRVPIPAGFRAAEAPQEAGKAGQPPEPEILELPGRGEGPGIVVVPGNPGIPHFYCAFGRHLQEALLARGAGGPAVYVLGYTNFVTASARSGPVASIGEEAARFGPALARLAARHPEAGLVLVGQSVGAWCMLRLLREAAEQGKGHLAGVRVPLLVLATPYLEFDAASGMQGFYRRFFGLPFVPALVAAISGLAVLLPRWLQRRLAPVVASGLSEEDVEVGIATFGSQAHHLESVVFMAATEFEALDPERPSNGFAAVESLLQAAERPRLLAVFAQGDMWGGAEHERRLRRLCAGAADAGRSAAEVLNAGNVQHAFVLVPEQSRKVADIIAERLAPGPNGAGCGD
mmetsp:Transcript_101842/g.328671  ORF Transcript_101842/g.328671 Transcript_101842/m.328671 type:complete len:387 (+) Transcript_101842:57-1217(+)